MAASRFLGHPSPLTQGSELGSCDPRLQGDTVTAHPCRAAGATPSSSFPRDPTRARLQEMAGSPAGAGSASWRPRPAESWGRPGSPRAGRETPPGRLSLPHGGLPGRPPGLPARSPPSWQRPCRRSAPPARPAAPAAAAAPGRPCRSWLGFA